MRIYDNDLTKIIGKTIINATGFEPGSESATFECSDGSRLVMRYEPDCCASCSIEDIAGDAADLVGTPVVRAERPSSLDGFDEKPPGDYVPESHTWTFVILGTTKGTVTVRWYGSSNGYYSESPSFYWPCRARTRTSRRTSRGTRAGP